MATIRTTCAYCGVGCGIEARVTGPRTVTIAGDNTHPANGGKLCSKGTHLGETVGLEGRLLHPMKGDKRVSWDAALGEVAMKMQACIEQYGPDSVAFYVSGQLLTEDYYVANKLMKGFVGSANIDTNSRLCMASAVAAHNRAFGEDIVPCSYSDLDDADLILLVGSNTAWCHPVIWQRIEAAREMRGTKLVVIDPRRTETAERADLHIPIEPDGDTALFTALLASMRQRGLVNDAYLDQHCNVPPDFWDTLNADAGIAPEIFAALEDLATASDRMVTLFSQGANQSTGGTDKGNAIINLHLATGRIGRAGAGPFSITGQPNAMGGREVGGLANTLACHLGFSEDERAAVAGFWGTSRLCERQGLKAVDLFRKIHEGDVKFLWVMATNPAVSMPNAGFVREALERCETVVVSDVMADTDTCRFADIRLPALAWGEKEGTVTNSERFVSRQRALFDAPGEARADWQIVRDVACLMGHGDAFAFDDAASVFREFAAMTQLAVDRGKALDFTRWADCTSDAYDTMQPHQWGKRHPLRDHFPTTDGKARLVAVSPCAQPARDMAYPLRLNTGRYRDQWHTMTRTGLSPKLAHHHREPLVEIHPADASGLTEGGFARVSTNFGSSIFRVSITDAQQAGGIFVPMHFTDIVSGGGRTGLLAQPLADPVSGQPGFKNTPAKIRPFLPDWRAFLVSHDHVTPAADYWARSRIENGWLTELAGTGNVAPIKDMLPGGSIVEVADLAKGMRRYAVIGEDGKLEAALFLTRSGQLPNREWIAGQIGQAEQTIPELLAGRPAEPGPDRGPIVCVCHDVGEQEILKSIASGATDVTAVGHCTKAGTNCGSCRPILARMISERSDAFKQAAQ